MNPITADTTLRLPREKRVSIQVERLLTTLVFTVVTGLCAKLRFYLPFTPMPVTGQVFAVLLAGIFLGKSYGSMSQVFYILFGLVGVPWFVIGPAGPTWGYLVGFILAPYTIGLIRERVKHLNILTNVCAALAGIMTIYSLGLIHFSVYMHSGIVKSFQLAVLPFIPIDIGKAIVAAFVAQLLFRKTELQI
jgi:biotin transport system substrate-specific component